MPPQIVFATTCKGRLAHLAQTLPRNLAGNPGAKFVLLGYRDGPELAGYILTHHQQDIASGRLVFYELPGEGPFHVAHAKNVAARCGLREGAKILVTLDADNFAGDGFAEFIAEKFAEPGVRPGIFLCPDFLLIHSLPHGPERPARGYAGRLALWAQDFVKAGGYDEAFSTWRGEDTDMIFRLQRMGYAMRHIGNRYLEVIPHGAEVRFKEYPHARQYENKDEAKAIEARGATVANFGRFGCGAVCRNFDYARPVTLAPVPTRIFGVGMHKTATTSLHAALGMLGFDSFHWGEGEAPLIWHEMRRLGRSRTLEQHYALSDLPIPLLFRELDCAYPGSKFILTVRDEAKWLASVQRLWDRRHNPTRWVWDVYPFSHQIHRELYGRKDFDAAVFLARYRRHNREVLEYFRKRPEDLLLMRMDQGAGWPELCAFLGCAAPGAPYPRENPSGARRHWLSTV